MRHFFIGLFIVIVMFGLAGMCGSDCPDLTSAEQYINFKIGAGMFFSGAAGAFLLWEK